MRIARSTSSGGLFSRLAFSAVLALFCLSVLPPNAWGQGDQAPDQDDAPAAEKVELPGIKIDVKNKRVDVQAKVTLDNGLLELIACTSDTKEHESIVMIEAVPMHIHAALLLIGANNGNPAMIKPANEDKTRWIHLPPRGDPIGVSLVYQDPEDEKKQIERPISDFLKRAERDDGFEPDVEEDEELEGAAEVFDTFLFAGSQVIDDPDVGRLYVADQSGNVISISTFGDELLCMPTRHSQENHSLAWAVDSTHLPKVGTKVTLRLTLKDLPEEQEQP